ncbi:unnamed protein product [Phytophthora fragariaefolia]|uniref:RxLR effector protein n=1 Tax=Phytophthora fragariaefolia TaxID=1490495 RepID=A0A9W6XPC6_9STRA|nr:unnamed protein product [Phytophthora fragariaefolia]
MRFQYVVLLALAAVAAIADARPAESNRKLVVSGLREWARSRNERQNGRLLRDDSVTVGTEEERLNIKAMTDKLKSNSAIEKISGLFKRKITPGTLLKWAEKGKSPEKIFIKYKLDKAGDKLFDNPDFKIWYAYTAMVTKYDPEKAILTSLIARYGEPKLSSMIDAATKATGTGATDIALTLQTKQMTIWKEMGMNADDAFKVLSLNQNLDFGNPPQT